MAHVDLEKASADNATEAQRPDAKGGMTCQIGRVPQDAVPTLTVVYGRLIPPIGSTGADGVG